MRQSDRSSNFKSVLLVEIKSLYWEPSLLIRKMAYVLFVICRLMNVKVLPAFKIKK